MINHLLCVYCVSCVEVSFDSGRFVAVDIPDENSITSSTSAGVAVGNLLVRATVYTHIIVCACVNVYMNLRACICKRVHIIGYLCLTG